MRVLVFEHICGGGMARQPLEPPMLAMGMAMLRAVIADVRALGACVITLRDARIPFQCDGVGVHVVSPRQDPAARFAEAVRGVDHALVIAPETGGILEQWARRVTEARGHRPRWLGCAPRAIRLCGDKLALATHLALAGVPTPATFDGVAPGRAGLPAVVKPRDGAGCEHTCVLRALHEADRLPPRSDYITQPFVPGLACSAAFVVNGARVQPLRAGFQSIGGRHSLRYRGGRLPLEGPLERRALALGERAVRSVPGLAGFVGVDLVLGHRAAEDRVIEINPRLTVAYAGLRLLCADNLAAVMLAASDGVAAGSPGAPLRWKHGVVSYDSAGSVNWSQT